jgi:hypothetical protein
MELNTQPFWLTGRRHVVNLTDVTLEDAAYSVLSKSLNCSVAPVVLLPIKNILSRVEKAISSLPEKQLRRSDRRLLGSWRPPVI